MAVLQRQCGGTFISNRKSTIQTFQNLYPDVKTMRRHRHFDWIGGHQMLKKADIIFPPVYSKEVYVIPRHIRQRFPIRGRGLDGLRSLVSNRAENGATTTQV